jgi:hypothetical protein
MRFAGWGGPLGGMGRRRVIGGSIDAALQRADRIVRLHWEAIKLVADMLEEHDRVSGEQVDAVLAQTCGGYPG